MAISTFKTFLMHKKEASTYEKLVDITEFPDLGSDPELLETTTTSDRMKTYILGILGNEGLKFPANYDHTAYKALKKLEGKTDGWGVDFIKVDDIAYSTIYRDSHRKEIEGIRKAIDKTGRDIVLSLSPGPARLQDGSFLQKTANMWRLTDDFWDEWELLYDMFDRCNYWSPFIRKGNWPDCDMLPLGHIGIRSGERGKADRMTCFTKPEQKTMITLWSIFQSPLMYGGELADLDEWTLSLLTNTEVNEMHRTLDGQRQEYRDDEWIVWSGENEENTYIAIFNVSDKKKEIPDKLAEIYIKEDAKEIWSGKKATEAAEEVDSHGCVLYQMKRM